MRVSDLSFVVAALVAVVLFFGCGGGALKTNAVIARAMLEVQAESGPIIRSARVAAAVEAGRAAHAEGLPESVAQDRAAAAADEWTCAVNGHRLFASAVGAYIDTLVLWSAGADFELPDVIPYALRAANDYRTLAACLASIGSDVLPVPAFFDLIPNEWAQPATEGEAQ